MKDRGKRQESCHRFVSVPLSRKKGKQLTGIFLGALLFLACFSHFSVSAETFSAETFSAETFDPDNQLIYVYTTENHTAVLNIDGRYLDNFVNDGYMDYWKSHAGDYDFISVNVRFTIDHPVVPAVYLNFIKQYANFSCIDMSSHGLSYTWRFDYDPSFVVTEDFDPYVAFSMADDVKALYPEGTTCVKADTNFASQKYGYHVKFSAISISIDNQKINVSDLYYPFFHKYAVEEIASYDGDYVWYSYLNNMSVAKDEIGWLYLSCYMEDHELKTVFKDSTWGYTEKKEDKTPENANVEWNEIRCGMDGTMFLSDEALTGTSVEDLPRFTMVSIGHSFEVWPVMPTMAPITSTVTPTGQTTAQTEQTTAPEVQSTAPFTEGEPATPVSTPDLRTGSPLQTAEAVPTEGSLQSESPLQTAETASATPAEQSESPGKTEVPSGQSTAAPIISVQQNVSIGDITNTGQTFTGSLSALKGKYKKKSVRLSWKNKNGGTVKKIAVYRKESGKKYQKLAVLSGEKSSYTDKKIKKGKRYRYQAGVMGENGAMLQETKVVSGVISVPIAAGPKVSLKKTKTSAARFLEIKLQKYKGNYAEIYLSKNGKNYKKVPLKSALLKRKTDRFLLRYGEKMGVVYCKVRTYVKKQGQKNYSSFSKAERIRL